MYHMHTCKHFFSNVFMWYIEAVFGYSDGFERSTLVIMIFLFSLQWNLLEGSISKHFHIHVSGFSRKLECDVVVL